MEPPTSQVVWDGRRTTMQTRSGRTVRSGKSAGNWKGMDHQAAQSANSLATYARLESDMTWSSANNKMKQVLALRVSEVGVRALALGLHAAHCVPSWVRWGRQWCGTKPPRGWVHTLAGPHTPWPLAQPEGGARVLVCEQSFKSAWGGWCLATPCLCGREVREGARKVVVVG